MSRTWQFAVLLALLVASPSLAFDSLRSLLEVCSARISEISFGPVRLERFVKGRVPHRLMRMLREHGEPIFGQAVAVVQATINQPFDLGIEVASNSSAKAPFFSNRLLLTKRILPWRANALSARSTDAENTFVRIAEAAIETGRKIHFDIAGLDHQRFKAFEYWQLAFIVHSPQLLKNTVFYRDGQRLPRENVLAWMQQGNTELLFELGKARTEQGRALVISRRSPVPLREGSR